MNSMCPCDRNTRKACSQCQREEVGPFFSHEAPAAQTPTLTFSDAAREREKERTGSERGRKSGVMPNFLTFSERERKVIEPTERIIKRPLRTISREYYQSRAAGVFFMVQKSCCFFEVSSKFHCDTRGHSEVVNERVTQ